MRHTSSVCKFYLDTVMPFEGSEETTFWELESSLAPQNFTCKKTSISLSIMCHIYFWWQEWSQSSPWQQSHLRDTHLELSSGKFSHPLMWWRSGLYSQDLTKKRRQHQQIYIQILQVSTRGNRYFASHSHSSTGVDVLAACSSSAVWSTPPPPPLHAVSPQGAGDSWLPKASADVLSSTASVFTCIAATSLQPPFRFPSMVHPGTRTHQPNGGQTQIRMRRRWMGRKFRDRESQTDGGGGRGLSHHSRCWSRDNLTILVSYARNGRARPSRPHHTTSVGFSWGAEKWQRCPPRTADAQRGCAALSTDLLLATVAVTSAGRTESTNQTLKMGFWS